MALRKLTGQNRIMSQDQTNKEALFNEVKGSLFEYLMARRLAQKGHEELIFLESLDKNYLNVLSQQDRMVRQFYPEMLIFLNEVTELSTEKLISFLGELPHNIQLRGKFVNSSLAQEFHEADLLFQTSQGQIPLSLKLNKKNAFVNTKSGGIKSFFENYFPFISGEVQVHFNMMVDQEFSRMSFELHELNDMDYPGDFSQWVKQNKSELPGELNKGERAILKKFYARIGSEMHRILSEAQSANPKAFKHSLPALMGFSSPQILQLVCFHDFKTHGKPEVCLHSFDQVEKGLGQIRIRSFSQTSSVEILIGDWTLQIRVKPMNKFTTTAIKINCSVRFRPGDET